MMAFITDITAVATRFYRTQQYLLLYRGTPEKQCGYLELGLKDERAQASWC